MFKLGSRLLVTAVLLAAVAALAPSGNASGAQRTSVYEDPSGPAPGTGRIQLIGTPDSGEPDIGQTSRNAPDGSSGEALDGGVLTALPAIRLGTSGLFQWVTVIWTLRYLGLGT